MNEQLQLGTCSSGLPGSAGGPEVFSPQSDLDVKIEKALRTVTLPESEKELLRVLSMHRGALNAIKSASLAEQLGLPAGENSRRWVAGTVQNLVELHRIPIGGLRVPPYGYFLIETRNDLDLAIGARWGEIYAHLRYLRALTSRRDVARLFGQQMLKLDQESGEVAKGPSGEAVRESA